MKLYCRVKNIMIEKISWAESFILERKEEKRLSSYHTNCKNLCNNNSTTQHKPKQKYGQK